MAEESSAEPMKQAKGLLDAYQAGGQLQLLVDAATILMTTPQVMLVDPERSRLTYDVADAILGVASRDRRRAGDFLDGGLRMVEAELDGIVGSFGPPLDFYSAGLLLTMRAALLSERYYLEHRVEDLAAALGDVQSATDYLTIPRLFDDPDAAWLWQTVASILSRQADFTHRIDHLEAVVQALEQARAAQGASDNVRAQIRWKLAIARDSTRPSPRSRT